MTYRAQPADPMVCPYCLAELPGKICPGYISPEQIEAGATALGVCDFCSEEYSINSQLDGSVRVRLI